MSRFLAVVKDKNIRILIAYGGLRSVVFVGSGLFAYYVLSVLSYPARILGIIVSAGFLASAMGSVLGGHLTDNIGRKQTLAVSSILAGAGWMALSLSGDWLQSAFSYGVVSGMTACAFPAYTAVVAEYTPEDIGGGLGVINTATSIVSSIGAFVGAATARCLGFRILFVVVSLPWLLSVCPILWMEEREKEESGKPESSPLSHLLMLRENQGLLIMSLSVLMVTVGGYAANFYPDYVKREFVVESIRMGVFDSIYSAVWAATNFPMGLLSDKVGRRIVVFVGYFLMGAAWILFPVPRSLFWLYVLYAVYSLGNSMGFFTTALVADISPEGMKGTAVGVFNSFMYFGVFMSGIVGGVLWEKIGALASFRTSCAALLFAATIIYSLVKGRDMSQN